MLIQQRRISQYPVIMARAIGHRRSERRCIEGSFQALVMAAVSKHQPELGQYAESLQCRDNDKDIF